MTEAAALIDRLSPAQRHVLLRCSDAPEWGRVGYGMARDWRDLVHGRRGGQYRSIRALARLGIVFPDERLSGFWRLTALGLAVQLELRMRLGKGAW